MTASEIIRDELHGLTELFNPYVVYQGYFGFSSDFLVYASKKVNGKNMAEEFLNRMYIEKVKSLLPKVRFTSDFSLYFESIDTDYGRILRVSSQTFAYCLCKKLFGNVPSIILESKTKEELLENMTSFLKEKRNQVINVISGKEKSPELEDVYIQSEQYKFKTTKNINNMDTYEQFLDSYKKSVVSLIVNFKYLIEIFEKPVDLAELEECLNLEQFYLIMARHLLDYSNLMIEKFGHIHSSIVFVAKYIDAVNKVRSFEKYKMKVEMPDLRKDILLWDKIRKCNVDELIIEYNKVKLSHPEFSIVEIPNDGTDYRNMDVANKLREEQLRLLESKRLKAAWNFIEKGTNDTEPVDKETLNRLKNGNRKNNGKGKKKSIEERTQAINDRQRFLDNTNYMYKVMGKGTFDGYQGYIYPNGNVIFEKFYENFEKKIPADSNATYVMTFANFVEMSAKTKPEIRQFIKDGNTGVKRIYHTETWCSRITQVIVDKGYDKEAQEKIESLIKDGQLKRLVKND